MATKIKINPVNKRIGARIREWRTDNNKPQTVIASILKVTCQQVSKYELGVNGISAADLDRIAKRTGKPIEWFFVTL